MADVQVAVGFGRKAGLDGGVFAAFEVFFDDGADEVVVGKLVFGQHNVSNGWYFNIKTGCRLLLAMAVQGGDFT